MATSSPSLVRTARKIMWYNLKKKISRRIFDQQIRGIGATSPMPVVDAPWSIVSMVAKPDIMMYLLSMKSFYRKLRRGKLIAIIDRDTPLWGRSILEQHFPGIRLIFLEDIDPTPIQRGGTWERLVYLIRHSQNEYVIQVDCDTLVVGDDIKEVVHCAENNIPFAYADINWSIKSLREIAEESKTIQSDYVGIVLERSFADWPDADTVKYVRASSGLAGFAKGGFTIPQLEQFHARMKQSLGPRWRDWGTEQSGSNFAVANSPNAITLPYPEYLTGPLRSHDARTKFIHFIGSNRFRDNYFAGQGKRIIGELQGKA
jgi:hypothetical protein